MNARLIRRYGRSLAEVAFAQGKVDSVRGDLIRICAVLEATPELAEIVAGPFLQGEQIKALVGEVTARLHLQDISRNFLMLVAENRRLADFPGMVERFTAESDRLSGCVRAIVRSALPLTGDQRQRLREKLAKRFKRQVILEETTTPELLGGLMVSVGDQVFDNSIDTRLQRIQTLLAKEER